MLRIPSAALRPLFLAGTLATVTACADGSPVGTVHRSAPGAFPLGAVQPMDPAINPHDTWVTYDATREQTTYLVLQEPVVDPMSGQPQTELTLHSPAVTLHTEAGYDVHGTVRVNEYRQAPTADPYEEPVDETVLLQTIGSEVIAHDASGEVTIASHEASSSEPPLADLGSLDGAQVTQGVLLNRHDVELIMTSRATPGGVLASTAPAGERVERLPGDRVRIVSVHGVDRPTGGQALAIPGRGRGTEVTVARRYARQGERYVLEEVEVESRSEDERGTIRMRETTRLRNVRWRENRAKDEDRSRRRERHAQAAATGAVSNPPTRSVHDDPSHPGCGTVGATLDPFAPCWTDTGEAPDPAWGGSTGSSEPCAGADPNARNIVFQHGFHSDSTTWWRMIPWMRTDLVLGCALRPSLTWSSGIAVQSWQLNNRIQGTGRSGFILVGHSQGGLVSRHTAQTYPADVFGVVTIGTPHQGAPIARTSSTAIFGGMAAVSAVATYGCATGATRVACAANSLKLAGSLGFLASLGADLTIPSKADLKPGSAFLQTLNATPEAFPRVGIQHYPKKMWVEWRLLGDMEDVPEGPRGGRRQVKRANAAFASNVGCGVVGWLTGSGSMAAQCTSRAGGMLATTLLWNLTTTGNLGKTDGIIPGYSQIYPNALQNYEIKNGDSHVGETTSPHTRVALRDALRLQFQVPRD